MNWHSANTKGMPKNHKKIHGLDEPFEWTGRDLLVFYNSTSHSVFFSRHRTQATTGNRWLYLQGVQFLWGIQRLKLASINNQCDASFFASCAMFSILWCPSWTLQKIIRKTLEFCYFVKCNCPKNPWTLQWRGLNLYTRGVLGSSK